MYPSFSAVTHLELLDPENDGTVILQDVSNYLHIEKAEDLNLQQHLCGILKSFKILFIQKLKI